jgi:hypothetical protein
MFFEGRTSTTYVAGRELNIYRVTLGEYRFRLAACVRNDDGFPNCGAFSNRLGFVVTEAIYEPYLEAASGVNPEELVAGPIVSAAVVGGPDELSPGMWWNPAKLGHGWSYYWANRLALSSKHDLPLRGYASSECQLAEFSWVREPYICR